MQGDFKSQLVDWLNFGAIEKHSSSPFWCLCCRGQLKGDRMGDPSQTRETLVQTAHTAQVSYLMV